MGAPLVAANKAASHSRVKQPIPICTREIIRGIWNARFPAPSVTSIPLVPCALLHCGADKLADQRQELFGVPGVKLLQQSEQSQDEWRPVHGVSRLPADHSCKERQRRN